MAPDSLRDTTAVAPAPAVSDTTAADTAAAAVDTVAAAVDSTPPPPAAVVLPDSVVVVDRVLAVVGNRPVLASQVDEELFSRQAQGMKLPDDPKHLDACAARWSRPSLTRSCWCSRRCATRRSW